MQLFTFNKNGTPTVGVKNGDTAVDVSIAAPELPKDLKGIITAGKAAQDKIKSVVANAPANAVFSEKDITYLPPIAAPEKIICVGLNYIDHTAETKFEKPNYPVLFTRFPSTLVAHKHPLIKPKCSDKFDYEGELVAVIGKTIRHADRQQALDAIWGYSIFNDVTVRDYQNKTHQWTVGKNFDASGGFGPYVVTADALPSEGKGLRLQTRINGNLLQDADTKDMVFDILEIITTVTETMALNPGDIIVSGTPAGVGFARTPPLYLKGGDVCEISIEGIGTLVNSVVNE